MEFGDIYNNISEAIGDAPLTSLVMNKFDKIDRVRDEDWLNASFMTSNDEAEEVWNFRRFYTTADSKYTDSSLGGAFVCNPLPQFTRYADVRSKGRRTGHVSDVSIYSNDWSTGQGGYYSEAFEDTQQVILFEPGVPQFGSLFSFISHAVDQPTSEMAKHATSSGAYAFGKRLVEIVMLYKLGIKALIPISIWALQFGIKMYFGDTVAKYYWLKPATHVYWSAVNNMVTYMAADLGVIEPVLSDPEPNTYGAPLKMTKEALASMAKLYGDFLTEADVNGDMMASTGFVDVRRLVSRANIIRNEEVGKFNKGLIKGTINKPSDIQDAALSAVTDVVGQTFVDFLDEVFEIPLYKHSGPSATPGNLNAIENKTEQEATNGKTPSGGLKVTIGKKVDEWQRDTLKYLKSASAGGSRYIAFRVEYLGEETVTFENGIVDIPTKGAMNNLGGATRNIEFMTAGGNVFGNAIGSLVRGIVDMSEGALSGITFGGSNILLALLNGGYVEMPKMWDDSSMSLTTHNFKFHLPLTSNHPMAVLTQQLIPLSMILALSIPMATGLATYTSPLLVKSFMKGIVNEELSMITNLSISMGTGNIGRDINNRSLGIDVNFTVTSLSNHLASPISSFANGSLNNTIADDSNMGRFLTRLSGRDVTTAKYNSKKFLRRATRFLSDVDKVTSPGFLSAMMGDFLNPVTGLFLEDASYINKQGF